MSEQDGERKEQNSDGTPTDSASDVNRSSSSSGTTTTPKAQGNGGGGSKVHRANTRDNDGNNPQKDCEHNVPNEDGPGIPSEVEVSPNGDASNSSITDSNARKGSRESSIVSRAQALLQRTSTRVWGGKMTMFCCCVVSTFCILVIVAALTLGIIFIMREADGRFSKSLPPAAITSSPIAVPTTSPSMPPTMTPTLAPAPKFRQYQPSSPTTESLPDGWIIFGFLIAAYVWWRCAKTNQDEES